MSRQYITTAIDYPNAAPHMGHVLERVLADSCARWFRLRGDEVRFQIGMDEHGVKVQRAAEDQGVEPQKLADTNAKVFQDLFDTLDISYDCFVRTSDKKVHWPTVIAMWEKLAAASVLEKRSYTGQYCSGCERFLTRRDMEDGKCPTHKRAPDEVTEENWFFLMSRMVEELRALLTTPLSKGGYEIVPTFRAKETLSLIDQGLDDVSFSRSKENLTWGVPVPGDEEQTMYVWCDALTNYISTLGYFTENEERQWWDDAEVTHVIGKDITRFHALIWPGMLQSVGVRTPDRLVVHGFLTSEGEKMSKSLGNVVVPAEVLAKFGGNPDPLRFYLSHEVPVGRDGDFSWERFEMLYDSRLRNALGNLLNRVLTLLKKEGGQIVLPDDGKSDATQATAGWERYTASMNGFELHEAMKQVMGLVDTLNGGMDAAKPWTLEGEAKVHMLSRFAESLRHVALLLLPFMPRTAQRMSEQLGVPYAATMLDRDFVLTDAVKEFGGLGDKWRNVGEPAILFEPLEEAA